MYDVNENVYLLWDSKNRKKREDVKIDFERNEKMAVDVQVS